MTLHRETAAPGTEPREAEVLEQDSGRQPALPSETREDSAGPLPPRSTSGNADQSDFPGLSCR